MGFIHDTTTTSLRAYLTQTGRKYLVDGNKTDFQIKFFSLADPDVNYLQASQPAGDEYNTLPSGFVPDIAGMGDGYLTGVAGGVVQNFTLKGGSAVGRLGTSGNIGGFITPAGFASSTQAVLLNKRTTGYQILNFDVPIKLFGQNPIGTEGARVFVAPPSQGTSSDLYHAISTDGIVQWSVTDSQQKTASISINLNKPVGSYRGKIVLKVIPYKSVLSIDDSASTMTIDVRINVTNPVSGSSPNDSSSSPNDSSSTGSIFSLGFPN
jgi:hypothetical protein